MNNEMAMLDFLCKCVIFWFKEVWGLDFKIGGITIEARKFMKRETSNVLTKKNET